MTTFDHILNWKLLNGSHEFPGPDGGTCINEAAIIAAGFKYRSISSAGECPCRQSFSAIGNISLKLRTTIRTTRWFSISGVSALPARRITNGISNFCRSTSGMLSFSEIGKQAEPLDIALVCDRMAKAKATAPEKASA